MTQLVSSQPYFSSSTFPSSPGLPWLPSLPGTTCLVALLSDKELTVANVGDSRGVLCDKDGNAIPLSHDHKPYQLKERKRIKKAGERETPQPGPSDITSPIDYHIKLQGSIRTQIVVWKTSNKSTYDQRLALLSFISTSCVS